MNISELISQHLPDDFLAQVAGKAGIQNPDQGVAAGKVAINALLQALANNASQENGAQSLLGALDKHHDGSILNDLMGMVLGGGAPQAQQAPAANPALNGAGILGHLLGFKQGNIVQSISQLMGGMDKGNIIKLLMTLAPVVMGILGKARSSQAIDNSNIGNILGRTVQTQQSANPGLGVIGKLLDRNGDGNMTDDLLKMGMQIFMK